jgi:hypothetical protein
VTAPNHLPRRKWARPSRPTAVQTAYAPPTLFDATPLRDYSAWPVGTVPDDLVPERRDASRVKRAPALVTSAMANDHATAGKPTVRLCVLLSLLVQPLTDFGTAECCGRPQSSTGSRRVELQRAGLIEPTGETRLSPNGSPAMIWRLTAAGRAYAEAHVAAMGEKARARIAAIAARNAAREA